MIGKFAMARRFSPSWGTATGGGNGRTSGKAQKSLPAAIWGRLYAVTGMKEAGELFRGQRADHHDHLTTFHLRHVLDLADFLDVACDAEQQLTTKVLVGHFSTTEPQGDFDLIAIFEEFEDVAHLHLIVVGVRVGTELDLFDLDDLLLLARFAFAFLLFILELAVVHDLADGRGGVGRNLYQIQTGLFSHLHRLGRMHNTDVIAICTDQADFGGADFVVDARAGITGRRRVMRSASYGFYPLIIAEI